LSKEWVGVLTALPEAVLRSHDTFPYQMWVIDVLTSHIQDLVNGVNCKLNTRETQILFTNSQIIGAQLTEADAHVIIESDGCKAVSDACTEYCNKKEAALQRIAREELDEERICSRDRGTWTCELVLVVRAKALAAFMEKLHVWATELFCPADYLRELCQCMAAQVVPTPRHASARASGWKQCLQSREHHPSSL
jgi:hypothetical protein